MKQNTPSSYRCSCKRFLSTDDLCQHVLAVPEKKKQLPEFLKLYKEKSNKASKVIFKNLPVNAGEKPSSKQRKGKNNVNARPITEELDPQKVSHPKPPNYTKYFHNDELFDVVFTILSAPHVM